MYFLVVGQPAYGAKKKRKHLIAAWICDYRRLHRCELKCWVTIFGHHATEAACESQKAEIQEFFNNRRDHLIRGSEWYLVMEIYWTGGRERRLHLAAHTISSANNVEIHNESLIMIIDIFDTQAAAAAQAEEGKRIFLKEYLRWPDGVKDLTRLTPATRNIAEQLQLLTE